MLTKLAAWEISYSITDFLLVQLTGKVQEFFLCTSWKKRFPIYVPFRISGPRYTIYKAKLLRALERVPHLPAGIAYNVNVTLAIAEVGIGTGKARTARRTFPNSRRQRKGNRGRVLSCRLTTGVFAFVPALRFFRSPVRFFLLHLPHLLLVLHPSVLEPRLHLSLAQTQSAGQLDPFRSRQVPLSGKSFFQSCQLWITEYGPGFPPSTVLQSVQRYFTC